MSGSPPWEPEWDEAFRQLWHEGLSYSRIADVLAHRFPGNRWTRSAIAGKAKRLDLQKPKSEIKHMLQRQARALGSGNKLKRKAKIKAVFTPLEAPPPPPALPPSCTPITIDQLTSSTCHWPIDPVGEHDWRYCGAQCAPTPRDAVRSESYCAYHRMIARPAGPGRRPKRFTAEAAAP